MDVRFLIEDEGGDMKWIIKGYKHMNGKINVNFNTRYKPVLCAWLIIWAINFSNLEGMH